jgi:hypothetical protein
MQEVFSDEEFNSDSGMMTAVWGPALWHSLHTISFNYPVNPTEEDKVRYYKYFKYLGKVLPCKYCRDNYKNNLKTTNYSIKVFENRDTLSRWVYNLHENVNSMLGKASGLSYQDVRNRYEHFRARCLLKDEQVVSEVNQKEKGCTQPLYGVKSKCVINIVPKDNRIKSFKIDPRCVIKRKKEEL